MTNHPLAIKRVYAEPAPADGRRVLVDRLWPRGLSKERARVDVWLRDSAPSDELRRWYGHDPAKYTQFRERYLAELRQAPGAGAVEQLRALLAGGPVTLLFAAREADLSNAAVLRDLLSGSA